MNYLDSVKRKFDTYPEKEMCPCAVAHYIAADLGLEPVIVGKALTELGVRLTQCQIGAFGYGRKGSSDHKIFGRKVEIPDEVVEKIRECSSNGRITCRCIWDIAEESGIFRCEVGNAADSLGIKIKDCQLGAF